MSPAGTNQPRSIGSMGTGAMLDECGVPKPVLDMRRGCKMLARVQASNVVLRSLKTQSYTIYHFVQLINFYRQRHCKPMV